MDFVSKDWFAENYYLPPSRLLQMLASTCQALKVGYSRLLIRHVLSAVPENFRMVESNKPETLSQALCIVSAVAPAAATKDPEKHLKWTKKGFAHPSTECLVDCLTVDPSLGKVLYDDAIALLKMPDID